MIIYIAINFTSDSIIQDFKSLKEH